MKRGIAFALASSLLFSLSTPCFADFQYTETTKITGGAAAGAMKFAGVFSKDARQATQGTTSTISFKGNKMRREDSLGQIEIIDLDARRITQIDTKKKTYSTITFDEMKARMEEARKKAAAEQAKRNKEQASQVKITPKVTITPGTGSKKILDYNAKETKMRVDMEMTSDDPKAKGQTANMWVDSDSYIAPVKGYDEVKHFYQRMAKELDWLPGTMMGGKRPDRSRDGRISQERHRLEWHALVFTGQRGDGRPARRAPAELPTTIKNPAAIPSRSIGGIFGKKKKKDDAAQDDQVQRKAHRRRRFPDGYQQLK